MATEVKWVKMTTNFFDDEKIKLFSADEHGETYTLFWIYLIMLAGKTNDNGLIYFAENVPYNAKMFQITFGRDEKIIQKALDIFEQYNMIGYTENGSIYLVNWDKYQSTGKLEKMKTSNKERQKKYRERQKSIAENNEDSNVTVTQDHNVTVTLHNATEERSKKKEVRSKKKEVEVEEKVKKEETVTPASAAELGAMTPEEREVFRLCQDVIGIKTHTTIELVHEMIARYGAATMSEAIRYADKQGVRTLSYVEGTLKGWCNDRKEQAANNRQCKQADMIPF